MAPIAGKKVHEFGLNQSRIAIAESVRKSHQSLDGSRTLNDSSVTKAPADIEKVEPAALNINSGELKVE